MTIENKQIANAQQGFATVLIVLLVGLAVAVSALGTAYYINMSQKSLVASHALTNAQSGAWTGVEVFRKYLEKIVEGSSKSEAIKAINALNGNILKLNIESSTVIEVNIKEVVPDSEQYRVTADIQNISDKSDSSSTIQAVYEISFNSASSSTGSPGSTITFSNAMNFYGDLDISGSVDLSSAGDGAVINVAGNFSGNTVKGVKRINSIGSVSLTGGYGTGVEQVYSNKYIIIGGSAAVTDVASALQYIRMTSAQSQGDFYAGNSQKIASGQIEKDDVYVKIESSGPVRSINTLNNISFNNGGSKLLGTAIAGGAIKCPGTWWNDYTSMRALIFENNCSTKKRSGLDGIKILDAIEVTEIAADTRPIVNALASQYKDSAQYIFYYDSNDKVEKVDVRDSFSSSTPTYITYQLDKKNGFLCKTLNASKQCSTPVIKLAPKLKTQGTDFIQYDQSKKLWTVTESSPNWSDGASVTPSLVPSIVLFDGNLKLGLGKFTNTFLTTGDITYGGSVKLYAPNYAGDDKVCKLSSVYKVQPNLCSAGKLTNLPVANIALLAGSCADDSSVSKCSTSYTGGIITLTNTADIEGNIIAGNKLDTSGTTNIKGSVLAAALGRNNESKLGASTTIDFNGTTNENTTITLPSNGGEDDGGQTTTPKVKMKWARYI